MSHTKAKRREAEREYYEQNRRKSANEESSSTLPGEGRRASQSKSGLRTETDRGEQGTAPSVSRRASDSTQDANGDIRETARISDSDESGIDIDFDPTKFKRQSGKEIDKVEHEKGHITADTRKLEDAIEKDYRRTLQGRRVQGVQARKTGEETPSGWIRTHEVSDPLLSRLGRAYGKRVILVTNFRPETRFEGVTLPSIPDAIFINANASHPHLAILGHELNHHLKKDLPEVYEQMRAELFSMLSPDAIKKYQNRLKDFPEGQDIDLLTDEMIGDLVGDNFMKPTFWKTLSERLPDIFKDIAESVIKFFNSAFKRMKIRKDLGSSEYFKDTERAKAAVEKAYTEYAAIMQFENPRPDMYVVHNLTANS